MCVCIIFLKKGYESKTFVRAHLFEDPQISLKYMWIYIYICAYMRGRRERLKKLPSGIYKRQSARV